MAQAAETTETSLRAQYAERIHAAWHKSREKIIALGRALIEAKLALPRGEFLAMIEHDLPFGPRSAQRFMRICMDPRLTKATDLSHCGVETLSELERLSDEEFEAGLARGLMRPNVTAAEVVAFRREVRKEGPHRPRHAQIAPPGPPAGAVSVDLERATATTYSEMVWLLAQRRDALGMTQIDLDQRIGWADGMTSKLEIPHMQDGRVAGPGTLNDWLQALGVGLRVVMI